MATNEKAWESGLSAFGSQMNYIETTDERQDISLDIARKWCMERPDPVNDQIEPYSDIDYVFSKRGRVASKFDRPI